jgi:hypothetical protein
MHLGKKAAPVLAEHKAWTLFDKTVKIRPVENPLAMYAEFAGRVMAWMNALDALVGELGSPSYSGGEGVGEQIRGEVQIFERAMDRCNTVLATYARLNIDERLVAITASQKAMVVGAIERALAAAGLTGAAAADAKKVVARHLRSVDAA